MSRLDQDRVLDILAEAVELPAALRGAFLDSTCGDPELRREVEELLTCADPASAAFDAASQQIVQPDPEQIGPYEILEPVGEGGMATVYKARQHDPVKRIVALKLIKLGMDTRQFVSRFESERQALAMMDHPNVARVYDAGSTETGRPYFVMEYVAGPSILDYCDGQNLGLRQRLELFMVVCDAVEHAHRKGIIHRDIKNSNVLVTQVDGKAVPKVIDFGVAKTIQQPLTDRSMFTEQGQLIGTPEYMSPEQAERGAVDIDTRADVYSLGVLMYELIAGVQPIPSDVWRSGSFEQVQRIIRETEPPRPSTRLSTLEGAEGTRIAERRRTALPTLIRELRSELEWIPLKAMRKDREQRYRSAAELADDIRNFLEGRPLIAGPESGWYRTRKFLRRHKTGVAASAAMVLLLLGGSSATTWQAVRATRAERQAVRDRTDAELQRSRTQAALVDARNANTNLRAVNDFLALDVLARAKPEYTRGRELTIREALDAAAKNVATRFKDRSMSQAIIHNALGDAYHYLGNPELADTHAHIAADIVRQTKSENDPAGIDILHNLGVQFRRQGRLDEAEKILLKNLQTCRRLHGDEHEQTIRAMISYAAVLRASGRLSEAEPLQRQTLELASRVMGPDDRHTLVAMSDMVVLLKSQEKLAEAESLARQMFDVHQRTYGADHPDTLKSLDALASLHLLRGNFAEAEAMLRQLISGNRKILGEDHPETIDAASEMAKALMSQGKGEEAELLVRENLRRVDTTWPKDHPNRQDILNDAAVVLMQRGEFADAEPLFREALERSRAVYGEDHSTSLTMAMNVAFVLNKQGKLDEAEALLRQTIIGQERVLGQEHLVTLAGKNNLGGLLFDRGKFADAEPLFREALKGRRKKLGDAHSDTLGTMSNLGRVLREQGRFTDAELVFAELYRSSRVAQLSPRQAALFASHWGPCLVKLARYEQAEQPLREAYQRLTAAGMEKDARTRAVVTALAEVCDHTDRPDEAASWRAKLKALQAATQPATTPA